MSIKPTLYWSEKIVMAYLIKAAEIHRRMPEVKVAGYHCLWPHHMIEDEADHLCEIIHGKPTLGPPMPPEVDFQDEVMAWLRLLERRQQQVVWMRANGIPWKILEAEFDRSKPTLWRELGRCLQTMISHLNQIDLRGHHFKQLRSRAYGYL